MPAPPTTPPADEAWPHVLSQPSAEGELARRALREVLCARLERALGSRAAGHVDDFVQDAMIRILDQLASFRGDSRFTTWATAIALRVAFAEMRRMRWKDVSLDALIDAGADVTVPGGALEPARGHDEIDLLLRAVEERLTARQRTVIIAELRGLPVDEVARRLGATRNAIYKTAHDARRALRHALLEAGLETHAAPFTSKESCP